MKQPCVRAVLEIQTRCTASRPETQDRQPRRDTWITVSRSKAQTHLFFFQENLLVFFCVWAQAKPSHFHLLKAAVFSEGAAPSAEHHPGRFMKVNALYRGQDIAPVTQYNTRARKGSFKRRCFNVRLFCDCIMNIIYSFDQLFCAAASHTLWLFKQLRCLKRVCLK